MKINRRKIFHIPLDLVVGVPAVLEQKTTIRCKYLYRHLIHAKHAYLPSRLGDPSPGIEPSRISLSGSTQRAQTLAVPRLINWKIVFAEWIDVFEACRREMGQVLLVHGIPLG